MSIKWFFVMENTCIFKEANENATHLNLTQLYKVSLLPFTSHFSFSRIE